MRSVQVVNSQRGIALIQVLLLTAVLSLMALQFTYSARQQVNTANQMLNKVQAQVKMRSAESEVLFALMTQPKNIENREYMEADQVSEKWNFYGQPFSYRAGTEIILQDVNGLLSLFGNTNNPRLMRLLIDLGKSESEATAIVARINQWQGNDVADWSVRNEKTGRNNFMLSMSELKHIDGVDGMLYDQLSPLVSAYPTSLFNPMNAPEPLLKQWIFNQEVRNEVIRLREAGMLDRYRFTELTGIEEDDQITFWPGRRIVIEVGSEVGEARASKQMVCYIRPENDNPLIWFQ